MNMKWAEKFGWGFGDRLVVAIFEALKKKRLDEEAAALSETLEKPSEMLEEILKLDPMDNHRAEWKQNRINRSMTERK